MHRTNKNLTIFFAISSLLICDNVMAYDNVSCGGITNIPAKIVTLVNIAVNIIQVAIPIIIVILGSLDLIKGVTASKEDEIKKGQQLFVKRLIAGASIFFIVVIVKLLISVVADANDKNGITNCIECFIVDKANCH